MTDSRLSLLLVEDNPRDVELFREYFSEGLETGPKLTHSSSLSEALEELKNNTFDLAMLDLHLGDSSGMDTFQAVQGVTPDLPVIVLTGLDDEQLARQMIQQGAQDYLLKGELTSHWLKKSLRYAIDRHQAQQERLESDRRFLRLARSIDEIFFIVEPDCNEVLYVNPAYEKIIGRPAEKLREDPEDFLAGVHQDDRKFVKSKLNQLSRGEPVDFEARVHSEDGFPRWIAVHGRTEQSNGEVTSIFGTAQDISKRKEYQAELESNLQKKETLMQELHHRVKNNMQVVSSLLNLQRNQVEDSTAREVLRSARQRIRTMALIHEQLYQSESLNIVQLDRYVRDLLQALVASQSSDEPVTLHLDILEGLKLDTDQAIPCALIINELVSNSFEHGFVGSITNPRLSVQSRFVDGEVLLVIEDNGVGMTPDVDPRQAGSLGFRLVDNLVNNQLKGTYTIHRDEGTRVEIKFPLKKD